MNDKISAILDEGKWYVPEARATAAEARVRELEAGLRFYACDCEPGSCENNSEPGEGDVCCGFTARALLEDAAP